MNITCKYCGGDHKILFFKKVPKYFCLDRVIVVTVTPNEMKYLLDTKENNL